MMPRPHAWAVAVIAFAAALVYLDALPNELLWDDLHLIVANPAIKQWSNVPDLFTSDLFPKGILSHYYRPLQSLTYLVDYQIWGLNPFGYRLTNVLLHAAAACLLYLLGVRVLASSRAACVGALLFAVHPIHTEAVAYVAGRSDPLAAVFLLGSLIAFLRYRASEHMRWLGFSLASFFLALLAREAALLWVALIAWTDRAQSAPAPGAGPAGRTRRRVAALALFAVPIAAYLLLRAQAIGLDSPPTTLAQIPLHERALTMLGVIVRYIGLLLLPIDLHMERSVPVADSILDPVVLASAVVVAALIAAAVRWRADARPISLGIVWFLLALLPVSNLLPLSTFMAEHWLYVPSMGLFLAAGWACDRLMLRGWKQPVATALVLIVASFGVLTLLRNREWRNGVTLYTATLRHAPQSARAWTNLGHAYQGQGRLDEAEAAYRQALRLSADAADVVQNLGTLSAERGQLAQAQESYQRAIALDATLADPHNNLGNLLRARGRHEEAVGEFERALALDPQHVSAYNNLALTLEALGRSNAAREALETALRIDPDFAVTHSNLGNHHFRRGELEKARAEYLIAVRLDPDYPEAYNNLGSVYFRLGETDLAIEAYRKALRIKPELTEVRRNLDIVLRSRQTSSGPKDPPTPAEQR